MISHLTKRKVMGQNLGNLSDLMSEEPFGET